MSLTVVGICRVVCQTVNVFLGAIVKLRKATINFDISVCHSARSNSALIGRIFMKFYI